MVWNSDSSQPDVTARVAALEATVADLQRRLNQVESTSQSASSGTAYGSQGSAVTDAVDPWSVAPWPEIVHLLLEGKKIQAIKVYRENFHVGLREAKDAVEEVERRVRG